ncbi:hypothetical protein [Geodermatophilus obscurus]|nr:hypothetical protein [Geodermatophilus obscurus]
MRRGRPGSRWPPPCCCSPAVSEVGAALADLPAALDVLTEAGALDD